MTLQDIVEDAEIKLDFFFKASLIHDLVNVSVTTNPCDFNAQIKNNAII